MRVTEADVAEIRALGAAFAPIECCGLLLTRSDGGRRIATVKNVASNPTDQVVMDNDDILDALRELSGPSYNGDLNKELVFWHTHPGGHVGPSQQDMQFRRQIEGTRCLVVTIPTGEAVQF